MYVCYINKDKTKNKRVVYENIISISLYFEEIN